MKHTYLYEIHFKINGELDYAHVRASSRIEAASMIPVGASFVSASIIGN
jgi:hypothetical protein